MSARGEPEAWSGELCRAWMEQEPDVVNKAADPGLLLVLEKEFQQTLARNLAFKAGDVCWHHPP